MEKIYKADFLIDILLAFRNNFFVVWWFSENKHLVEYCAKCAWQYFAIWPRKRIILIIWNGYNLHLSF